MTTLLASHSPAATAAAIRSELSSASAPLRPISVLVVDDNRVDRKRCRRILNTHPEFSVSVTEAASVEQAEAVCRAEWFDCIIADYQLAGRKGTELAQKYCADTDPPVILLTGNGDEVAAVEALQAGACNYLKKDVLTDHNLQLALSNAVRKSVLVRSVHTKSRELELANSELRKRAHEIEHFYHSVSHELKTPLTAAREFIALVLDEVLGDINARQRKFLGHAIECCDQLTVHFNDLVDTCRLETGKLRIAVAPQRIETAIVRASAAVAEMAAAKNISIQRSIDHGLPHVLIDLGRIVQVVANLLGNALKYSGPDSAVQIEAQVDAGGFVRVGVRDSGCGIAPEHLPRIFERLYQVNPAGDNQIGAGLGLGLYICRQIVDLHGGHMEVHSTVGAGSFFSFTVPVTLEAAPDGATGDSHVIPTRKRSQP